MAPEIHRTIKPRLVMPRTDAHTCGACGDLTYRRPVCDRCRAWLDTFLTVHARQPAIAELPAFMRERIA